jgi:hypothetical protein
MLQEDLIDKNGLEIGNGSSLTHDCTREDQERESVIELTLGNQLTEKLTIPGNDHTTGSDNEVIQWELGVDSQEEADHEKVVGQNLASMTDKDVEAGEKLWMELAKERAQLDAAYT